VLNLFLRCEDREAGEEAVALFRQDQFDKEKKNTQCHEILEAVLVTGELLGAEFLLFHLFYLTEHGDQVVTGVGGADVHAVGGRGDFLQ
jgi:hypothetical protein